MHLIWDRFFERLCDFARAKLGPTARRTQDEEDLALSAMHALCRGATEGRFRQLDNRDDLWQILLMITARKVSNARRRIGVRRETGECDIAAAGGDSCRLDELFQHAASPELFDSLDIHCDELLGLLNDKLRKVALLKLSGHSNEEIARIQQRGVSTIERYLQLIREIWTEAQVPVEE